MQIIQSICNQKNHMFFICSFLTSLFFWGFDWSIFNFRDFVLDHRAHRILGEGLNWGFLLFFWDDLWVLNWLCRFRVFSGISNNWGVSFDGSSVHWDLILWLFFSNWLSILLGIFLSSWLSTLSILLSVFLSILWCFSLSFGLSNGLILILIFSQIFGQWFNKIISESSLDSDGRGLLFSE